MQRAAKPSASLDNAAMPNVAVLNQTLSEVSQQLGNMSIQLTDMSVQLADMDSWLFTLEGQASAAESWSPGPSWPWKHSQLGQAPAHSYLATGSRLSKESPRGQSRTVQP